MPKLENAKWEAFAQGIAVKRLTPSDAYIYAGYSEHGAWASAARLLRDATVRARVDELQNAVTSEVVKVEISERSSRVAALQDLTDRLKTVFTERALDMPDVPGGKTGLLVRQIKQVGKGKVEEYAVDTGSIREYRAALQQAAQELGQWSEKSETTIKWDGDLSKLNPDQLAKLLAQMEEAAMAGAPELFAQVKAKVESETVQ